MKIFRYKAARWLVIGLPLFYIIMINLTPRFGGNLDEIYPFFRWSLFSRAPEWDKRLNAVTIDSVNSVAQADGPRFIVPSNNIRHMKVVRRIVSVCRKDDAGDECDSEAEEILYPIVRRAARSENVEFSVVDVYIDLRDVRDDIWSLAEGRSRPDEYYRICRVLFRWSAAAGEEFARVAPSTPDEAQLGRFCP